ncbi:1-phosphofructokinase [Fannyhessea vaginae PB189-T1-4]|uniref:1-phosphofructokinase n=1 Tax=Fannyhessea vaginae PB189-T1-4 TaxID=866774 RepID=A0ABP2J4W5_9ACTN|nr:1-phosphofructokinase [Fannyhessea vaginae PB189-T1-4]
MKGFLDFLSFLRHNKKGPFGKELVLIYTVTLNPALDYVMHPLTLDMGFTNRSSSEELLCGGNGINVSTLLNELHVVNVAFGIAAGFTGDYLIKTLQDSGVSANFVRLDEGFTRINVKLNGIVMTMCNGMGPNISQDKVDELLRRLECIAEGDTLILTGSIPKTLPEDIYDTIMHRLEGRGVRFVVDAPGALLMKSLPARPFLIKPNNHEVGRIFDAHPETPEDCIPYARQLHEQGAQNVIVSCGAHGSLLIDEHDEIHTCPTVKIQLENATGAGDSMVAGFVAKTQAGEDYESALRFASACGTATAASKGIATIDTITRVYKELEELIASSAASEK